FTIDFDNLAGGTELSQVCHHLASMGPRSKGEEAGCVERRGGMRLNYCRNLIDFRIGKGRAGAAATVVEFDSSHPAHARMPEIRPPPPLGGLVFEVPQEFGFIYTPNGGYVTVDAGTTANEIVGNAGVYEGNLASDVIETVLTGINNNGMAVGFYVAATRW